MRVPQEIDYSALQESGLKLPRFFSSWISAAKTRIDPYYLENEKLVVWRFFPGDEAEGPPGYCHGGFLATLLDECMGSCGIWEGLYLMAINLEVSFKKAVEKGSIMFCVCRLTSHKSRKVSAEGWITDESQKVYVFARGSYLSVDTAILKETPSGILAFERYRHLRSEGKSLKEALDILQSE